jgi:hypothetical protein
MAPYQKKMAIKLLDHQLDAVKRLKTGSILVGGVGSGKSLTALAYFYNQVCLGNSESGDPPIKKINLYIITTAKKRDSLDWESEAANYQFSPNVDSSILGIQLVIDSWNNIKKYTTILEPAFFIFDEQRIIGSGTWVRSFLKITKVHPWILLSATPGDNWLDYIPVFLANGFYKNRSEFLRRHVVFNNYVKYPKIDRFLETGLLERLKQELLVPMEFERKTVSIKIFCKAKYDSISYDKVWKNRWNIFGSRPIKESGELFHLIRRVVNSNPSRIEIVRKLLSENSRLIIFYNFNYELAELVKLSELLPIAQYNGHIHEPLPTGDRWAYLVQYTAGAEGWNCIETNAMCFYSLTYSYRALVQAEGRINRLNTKFKELYYYYIVSESPIDLAIMEAISNKKNFNEKSFLN